MFKLSTFIVSIAKLRLPTYCRSDLIMQLNEVSVTPIQRKSGSFNLTHNKISVLHEPREVTELSRWFFGVVAIFICANVNAQTSCIPTSQFGLTNAQQIRCDEERDSEFKNNIKKQDSYQKRVEKKISDNQLTLTQCTTIINANSGVIDFESAIDCLSKNPYAGKSYIESFLKISKGRLEQILQSPEGAGLQKKIDELFAKKQPLYWQIETPRSSFKGVLVADSYKFLPIVDNVYTEDTVFDLSSTSLSLVTMSRIWSADEVIPFSDFRSLSYLASTGSPDKTIGTFIVNENYRDEKFQGFNPFIVRTGDKPIRLTHIMGKIYAFRNGSFFKNEMVYDLSLPNINGSTIRLIDEVSAKSWISHVEEGIQAIKQEQENENLKIIIATDALVLKLKTASKGSEDSCQGSTFQDNSYFTCQMLEGRVALSLIKQSGWLVTNVSTIPGDRKVLITIRKAR